MNERNSDLIRRRAHVAKAGHPDLAEIIGEYVARQERERSDSQGRQRLWPTVAVLSS